MDLRPGYPGPEARRDEGFGAPFDLARGWDSVPSEIEVDGQPKDSRRVDASVAERRRHKRFFEEVRVRFRDIEGVEPSRWGRSRDLSLGGLCLCSAEPVSSGCHLALEVHIENETAPVLALGRVVRVSESEDAEDSETGVVTGIEFLWISEEDRANLQRLARYFREKYGESGAITSQDD